MAEGFTLAIAPARSDSELVTLSEIRTRVDPKTASTLDELHHRLATMTDLVYLVALLDGEPAGCAGAGGREGKRHLHADVSVVPELRRRGIGTALLRAVSAHADSVGADKLVIEVHEDDPESQGFLERRGFVEVERQKALVLDLAAVTEPVPQQPPGITIVTRAERPDVVEGMFAAAREAMRDIPGLDGAHEPSFEEWRGHEIDRPSRLPELTFVALDGDEVVGYAALDVFPSGVYHGLTAVRPAWRRRGVARALKLSQIAAAKAAGFAQLETESEETNVPMRRLNESLGYRPEPGMIVYRGPVQTGCLSRA